MAVHSTIIPTRAVLGWDIDTWSRALPVWKKACVQSLPKTARGLELGAWNGGVSAWFAHQGHSIICSDIEPVSANVGEFHHKLELDKLINYQSLSATKIPYSDETFDFVVFKSVLGAVGRNGRIDEQQRAIREIHRVLKPGGILFFAENLRGSRLHQFARKRFMAWGNSWRYCSFAEMESFLDPFLKKEMHATGFFAAFVPRPEWLKSLVARLDGLLFFVPKTWRYVGYGIAVK